MYLLSLIGSVNSSVNRFNVQTYRRLDTLRRRNRAALHCANALLSVDDTVWCLVMVFYYYLFSFVFQYSIFFC